MPLIEVKNLCKGFAGKKVIKNLNFSVWQGDYLYIVGENGSGKSTLMKLLLGLLTADSGEINYEGFKLNEIGYLPQSSEIQSDFPASVREVVLSGTQGRTFHPFYTKKNKKTAEQMMQKLGVSELKNSSFKELSGGQQQRVLLARALCATKKVLLLDEPLTGLDPVAAAEFYEIIDELRKSGVTVIVISHDISCAVHYGNKILHLGYNEFYFGTAEDYVKTPLGKKMLARGHCHE